MGCVHAYTSPWGLLGARMFVCAHARVPRFVGQPGTHLVHVEGVVLKAHGVRLAAPGLSVGKECGVEATEELADQARDGSFIDLGKWVEVGL